MYINSENFEQCFLQIKQENEDGKLEKFYTISRLKWITILAPSISDGKATRILRFYV